MTEFQLARFANLRRRRRQTDEDRARIARQQAEDDVVMAQRMRDDGWPEQRIAEEIAKRQRARVVSANPNK